MARTPTDPTKAQVWVTKGLDDIDFEFYFPQGPKGDPGGFTSGTLIGTTNLNSFKTAGLYRQDSGVSATLQSNYPIVGAAGILMVTEMAGTNYVVQEWHPLFGDSRGGRIFYRREFTTPNWSPWRPFTSPRIDQSAGRALYLWDDTNSREQLIYGDTGWRDITSLFPAGKVSNGRVIIRRSMHNVHFAFEELKFGGQSTIGNVLLDLPLGYRPAAAYPGNAFALAGGENGTYHIRIDNGYPGLNFQAVSSSTWLRSSHCWSTSDAWPTTLPGTAVTTPPNG